VLNNKKINRIRLSLVLGLGCKPCLKRDAHSTQPCVSVNIYLKFFLTFLPEQISKLNFYVNLSVWLSNG